MVWKLECTCTCMCPARGHERDDPSPALRRAYWLTTCPLPFQGRGLSIGSWLVRWAGHSPRSGLCVLVGLQIWVHLSPALCNSLGHTGGGHRAGGRCTPGRFQPWKKLPQVCVCVCGEIILLYNRSRRTHPRRKYASSMHRLVPLAGQGQEVDVWDLDSGLQPGSPSSSLHIFGVTQVGCGWGILADHGSFMGLPESEPMGGLSGSQCSSSLLFWREGERRTVRYCVPSTPKRKNTAIQGSVGGERSCWKMEIFLVEELQETPWMAM